jgi:hypothetical protein
VPDYIVENIDYIVELEEYTEIQCQNIIEQRLNFYGIEYDMITVSSAGWICPGGTEAAVFMNWIIPGPGGPSPMIAAFWDDLHNGSGDVYAAYDTEQHYFIIEWDNMQNEHNNEEETFQIILYDAEY